MIILKEPCPHCGHKYVEIGIDDSCGPPDEAGGVCDNCNSIPVWYIRPLIRYIIDEFAHFERVGPKGPLPDNEAGLHKPTPRTV